LRLPVWIASWTDPLALPLAEPGFPGPGPALGGCHRPNLPSSPCGRLLFARMSGLTWSLSLSPTRILHRLPAGSVPPLPTEPTSLYCRLSVPDFDARRSLLRTRFGQPSCTNPCIAARVPSGGILSADFTQDRLPSGRNPRKAQPIATFSQEMAGKLSSKNLPRTTGPPKNRCQRWIMHLHCALHLQQHCNAAPADRRAGCCRTGCENGKTALGGSRSRPGPERSPNFPPFFFLS
jgi:hypothetical protein